MREHEDVLIAAAKQINPQAFAEKTPTVSTSMNFGLRCTKNYFGPFENLDQDSREWGIFETPRWSNAVSLQNGVTNVAFQVPSVGGSGLALIPAPSIFHLDGRGANKPWLQETPHPINQIVGFLGRNPSRHCKKAWNSRRSVVS